MSQTISVEPDVFPSIAYYYESQCNDLMLIKEFVVANCTLDDAFGLLLSVMKPQYEEARDKTMNAMTSIAGLLRDVAAQADAYAAEIVEREAESTAELDAILARLDALETAAASTATASSSSGGGYGGGGGGGGGYSGPSGDVTTGATAETSTSDTSSADTSGDGNTNDGDDDGDTIINITVEGDNNTITIGEDGEIEVEPTTDETAPVAPPATNIPTDPVLDPAVVAAEDAQRAEFYDRLWEEQAAKDPLGRSADELRLAWESRESIELDVSAETSGQIGYGENTLAPMRMRFDLFAAATPSPEVLIGARA